MGKFIDLTGQKFGRLMVVKRTIDYVSPKGKPLTQWECLCQCGKTHIVSGLALKTGRVKSCGCLNNEKSSVTARENFTKHGCSKEHTYKTWINIKTRCNNKNALRYPDYGGRGIKVCDRWQNSFEAFYEDVSKIPHFGEQGYTLDRINNNGNYEPNNVRWANLCEQGNNKRNNRLLTYNGKTQTISEWARETGIKRTTLIMRLDKYGWSTERTLTTK